MAGLNIIKISTAYREYLHQPCEELKLFPNLELIILEKYTTIFRDLLYMLNITEIAIDMGRKKMTVFSKQTLENMWKNRENVFACFPIV